MAESCADRGVTDAALDREIEQALAIDPSPEFLARVRTRIASEPAAQRSRLPWLPMLAACTALVLAFVLTTWPAVSRIEPAPVVTRIVATPLNVPYDAQLPHGAVQPMLQETGRSREDSPSTSRRSAGAVVKATVEATVKEESPALNLPLVLIPRGEQAVLRRLMRGVHGGVVDEQSLRETPFDIAVLETSEIVLAPLLGLSSITIEPLGSSVQQEGVVRQ